MRGSAFKDGAPQVVTRATPLRQETMWQWEPLSTSSWARLEQGAHDWSVRLIIIYYHPTSTFFWMLCVVWRHPFVEEFGVRFGLSSSWAQALQLNLRQSSCKNHGRSLESCEVSKAAWFWALQPCHVVNPAGRWNFLDDLPIETPHL